MPVEPPFLTFGHDRLLKDPLDRRNEVSEGKLPLQSSRSVRHLASAELRFSRRLAR